MAIAAPAVAVNAAFLQEIKEDAQDLHELLECTVVLLTGPSWVRAQPRRLVQLLEQIRDQLALHFSLEEVYGYCDAAADGDPRHAAQAAALRSQHQELYRQICDLVEAAQQVLYHEAPTAGPDRLAVGFAALVDELHDHEVHENEMIAEAFDDDSRASGRSLVPGGLQQAVWQSGPPPGE